MKVMIHIFHIPTITAFCICAALSISGNVLHAQTAGVATTVADKAEFHRIMEQLENEESSLVSERMLKIAGLRLGTPYVSGTLEKEPEQLTIHLLKTDCILFVESCLAMAITGRDDFDEFADNVRNLEYRDGIVDGYSSRLHYTSEWLQQAEKLGILDEITADIGGLSLEQHFNFMSTHPQSYMQLKGNPDEVAKIEAIEKRLEGNDYHYIPKSAIPAMESLIKDGDIICFVGSIEGLDVTHVAIAYHDGGKLTFIHASTKYGKAVIEPSGLAAYCNSIKSNKGIRVARIR